MKRARACAHRRSAIVAVVGGLRTLEAEHALHWCLDCGALGETDHDDATMLRWCLPGAAGKKG